MAKRVVILQPGYLPWLGFFEQMYKCDIFVFLDDVQYTKNDWRNRNRIKTKDGVQWLTIPVSYRFGQKINEVHINNSQPWSKKHLQSLKTWYGRSKFYDIYIDELAGILNKREKFLIDLDIQLTLWLIEKLGLNKKIVLSSSLSIETNQQGGSCKPAALTEGDRQLRLIEMCRLLDCNYFYEGKSGQNYIDVGLFKSRGVIVEFQDYRHPYYNQLWLKEQGFISYLSIIDLLFNHGPDSLAILTGQEIIPLPEGMIVKYADKI